MQKKVGVTRRATIASAAVTIATTVAGCSGGSGNDQQTTEPVETDQQPLETTFEEGREGWTAVDMVSHGSTDDPDWSVVEETLDVNYRQSGGVDDSGHIERIDTTSSAFFFDGPDAYLGEKSAYAGGTVEFSLKSSHNNWRQDSGIILADSEGVITTEFAKPGTDWTRFRIDLDAKARTYHESNLGGPEVGQERLETALSDLQALRISGEHGADVEEEVGLDEVRLRKP